jgi:acetoacetyl-CoA synthetase
MPEPPVLWRPPHRRGRWPVESYRSSLDYFVEWLELNRGKILDGFNDYEGLWRWSVDDLEGFWGAIAEHFRVIFHDPPERVLADASMPGARWFPGATLNWAEHALRDPFDVIDDVVIIGRSESGDRTTLTMEQLVDAVRQMRAGLQRLGVGRGDRVAGYLPNVPEAAVALLATASLGAVWSSCAPEFGVRSVIDRFSQIEPKVLLGIDGYEYGGRVIPRSDELRAVRYGLPTLAATVVLPYIDPDAELPGTMRWTDAFGDAGGDLEFEPVPFDHPLYILFSSGTTGLPKPIVHGHGGILLEHLKIHRLHHDLIGPFFWYTTTGWMMWNYLVSGLLARVPIVLYDGAPNYPDLMALWRIAAEERISYFGASAPFLMACRKEGLRPARELDLSALRGIGSTGSPLPAEGFRWVYETFDPYVHLQSVSGGTDVCTAFVGASPMVPVWEGEISCRHLGCRVEAFDAKGKSVIGKQGELVLTAPMPSMPVAFWNDPDGSRYRAAYFEEYPGAWRHGDWITITDRGSCVISGRSDATLNRGGVRVGTAEFYAVVESIPEVADSLVVHLEDDDRLLLFVTLRGGHPLDDAVRARIVDELRSSLSPRHVPDEISAVPAVPRTLSGKKLEVPVKRILTGTPVDEAAARGSLANPESLDVFAALASAAPPQSV